ncbi:hypothetical protein ALI144C_34765 [Actinosynnema sp. ALI-1.44]|uniref:hypothetical protein n=1 Tax=Actinosynnema sp. ALI-1.44 TaxID=1933779 RepID=UPI00097C5595|nr:hypothetical protein [Actinosynnema sp. ALI-1.44]ONI77233.1 hypothetical protein ALI144C_34765 [Actinosynnema sp. ALI-1.44]
MVKGIGGEYVVAETTTASSTHNVVRWHKGVATVLGSPAQDPTYYMTPIDVSANGTVLATWTKVGSPWESHPYVTLLDGTHKFLPEPGPGAPPGAGPWTTAKAINAHGDVVGDVGMYDDNKLVLWKGSDYSTANVLGAGHPMGIDDSGFILKAPGIKVKPGQIAKPLKKPEGATSIYVHGYDNGTAIGNAKIGTAEKMTVWNDDGSVRYVVSGGLGRSANAKGMAVGGTGWNGNDPTLWRDGQSAELPTPPPVGSTTFVTDRDTLVGSYSVGNDVFAAEWTCS